MIFLKEYGANKLQQSIRLNCDLISIEILSTQRKTVQQL